MGDYGSCLAAFSSRSLSLRLTATLDGLSRGSIYLLLIYFANRNWTRAALQRHKMTCLERFRAIVSQSTPTSSKATTPSVNAASVTTDYGHNRKLTRVCDVLVAKYRAMFCHLAEKRACWRFEGDAGQKSPPHRRCPRSPVRVDHQISVSQLTEWIGEGRSNAVFTHASPMSWHNRRMFVGANGRC